MITVQKQADGVKVDITLESPSVYVDYAGLGILAKDRRLGARFKRALVGAGGTLYLSWAHLLELYGLGFGPTYVGLREYLEGFGNGFALIDCDAGAVISRERAWRLGLQNAALDVDLIKVLVANREQNNPLTIAVLLRLIDGDPASLQGCKSLHRQHRGSVHKLLEEARSSYRQNVTAKATLDAKEYVHIPGSPPTEYLRSQLLRESIKAQEPLRESDGIDYEHAVVALAYSDHVVLDKKWAARATRYPAPVPVARVWKVGELDALTKYLEAVHLFS